MLQSFKKTKQVKKNATKSIFEDFAGAKKQVGNPLQTTNKKEVKKVRGERNTDKNTRKFISISDMAKWEQIDEIMQNAK